MMFFYRGFLVYHPRESIWKAGKGKGFSDCVVKRRTKRRTAFGSGVKRMG